MTSRVDVAAKALDAETNIDINERPEGSNIIVISEADLARGGKGDREIHVSQKKRGERTHANDLLPHANYNDEPDPAVKATVEQLVDTSKVIELERIDFEAIPKKRVYHFVKRAFDIVSCSAALILCAIPMGIIAIMVKRDSPGPVFYKQERVGWSIIGQKSGAVSDYPARPALSALEVLSASHSRLRLGVVA